MRVILVSDYGDISGGAARVAISSARALADQGVEVVFACALAPVSAELDHPLIKVHCLGADSVWSIRERWRAAAQGIWNHNAGRWLRRLMAECDPRDAVVHIHQWTKAFSPSVLAAAAKSGLPFVVTMHDYFLACPNGAYFSYPKQRPCALQPMSSRCWAADCDSRSRGHKAVRLLRQLATDVVTRRTGRPLNLIHVSHHAAEIARPMLPGSARHWVVPNRIIPPVDARVPAERNRAVVCVGRITVEKGCVVLAKAAARAEMPLIIMGNGPALDQVRKANPRAEIRPWGNHAAVENCFSQARALALPSLWYETGGLVVQEALAHGIPAIVTTISGACDVVGDRGLLVPPGDVDKLAAALTKLRDDALVQRMSEAAYRFMNTRQQQSRHAQDLLNIYRTILADGEERAA